MDQNDAQKKIIETAGAAAELTKAIVMNPLKTAEIVITTPIKIADAIISGLFGF